MKGKPEPITEDHKLFSQELVALCRKHGARFLQAKFQLSSSARMRRHCDDWTDVSMVWHEGRHGADSTITLKAEAVFTANAPENLLEGDKNNG